MQIDKSAAIQNVLLGVGAVAMIAALVFLYNKTQAVDLRVENEVSGLLRELKEIDGRWDVDVLRAGLEPDSSALQPVDRRPAAERALRSLEEAASMKPRSVLGASLPELSKAIREKANLIEEFRKVNLEAKAGLNGLVGHATELGAAAQSPSTPSKNRTPGLDAVVNRLVNAAPLYYWLANESQSKVIEAGLGELQSVAASMPEAQREKAQQVLDAGLALLKHKAAEQQLAGRLALLTSGPRLDSLTIAFNRELETTMQGKELFRVYLIAYAGALLILLGWLGAKIRAANVGLEHRVQERTRELSDALRHLKESETQLIQSEKMSSLGQMVAGVAHEINTPLAYVKNSLGTVAEKLPELGTALNEAEQLLGLLQAGDEAKADELARQFSLVSQHLATLKKREVVKELSGLVNDGVYGTGQMAEIVGNLKDFSRLDRSKVNHFNLNDGLTSTLLLAKHLLKSITVDRQFGDIPEIVCSPSQINQVFLNLITNAAQAMENMQGTITLKTRTEGEGVAVDVLDNGKGIPPEVLPKIFDPFFSTKEIGKGTGLGLSISYKIIQQHGGRIDVKSQPGKGTRFTVRLPLKPPADAKLDK
ncbi:MAG: ATP-binding protein [Burkholderiales bacterium]